MGSVVSKVGWVWEKNLEVENLREGVRKRKEERESGGVLGLQWLVRRV